MIKSTKYNKGLVVLGVVHVEVSTLRLHLLGHYVIGVAELTLWPLVRGAVTHYLGLEGVGVWQVLAEGVCRYRLEPNIEIGRCNISLHIRDTIYSRYNIRAYCQLTLSTKTLLLFCLIISETQILCVIIYCYRI